MKPIAVLKRLVSVAAFVPAAMLLVRFYQNRLTANPVEYLTHDTGDWTIRFLVLSLCVTPIRRLTGWNDVIRLRKPLGLFAFFYALLHFLVWFALWSAFDVPTMIEDVSMRPFITLGMAAFVILVALAVTSPRVMIRRLGKRWQPLHRLVYVAAVAGVIHYWWLVKADVTLPRRWAIAVALLLGFRGWWAWRERTSSSF